MANKRSRLAGLLTSNPNIAEQVAVNNAVLGGLLGVGDEPSAMYPRAVRARRLSDLGGILSQAIPGETIAGLVAKGITALKGAPLLGAVTAWHGSPHKFDRFDLGKIGTGEGAQAYGHGLYLAESPAVAKSYKDALSAGRGAGDEDTIARVLDMVGGDRVKAANALRQRAEYANIPGGREKLLGMADKIDKGFDPRGSLYKTDIPDEAVARFLDWDKPLSEQAPELRALAKDLGVSEQETGAKLYQQLTNQARDVAIARGQNARTTLGSSQSAASDDLSALGIPGIRYLDAGSRTGGGTSNFVVFDPDMIRILERNNVPTGAQPWLPGEYQGILSR